MLGNYNEANAQKIIDFCKKVGFNGYAISGVLSNWYHESVFESNNAQNAFMNSLHMTDEQYTKAVDAGTWVHPTKNKGFCEDGIGYGLAQWTSAGRKTGLYNQVKANNKSIADFDEQLTFFWKEMTSSGYKTIHKKMIEATDEKQAAIDFMVYYERPASVNNQAARDARANTATEFYRKYFLNSAPSGYLMSATTFIQKLWDIARNYKTLYVMGPWGWPAMDKNKTRAINGHSYNATTARAAMIRNASRDTFFFDCIGLIKGILWGWCGDTNKVYGGAGYACNGVPDNSTFINLCKDVSADFSNIIPGELLSMPGHVGVYVGEGKVIECTPKWENCVQQSWLGNIGYTTGHSRMWEKHGKLPWIDYESVLQEQAPIVVKPDTKIEDEDIYVGEIVSYTVVKGDTLTKIAKKFSTTVEKIVALNNIANPNRISVGQKLLIKGTAPSEVTPTKKELTYVVRKGDTLSTIARKFNTTVIALATKNKILNPNRIVVGQVLVI